MKRFLTKQHIIGLLVGAATLISFLVLMALAVAYEKQIAQFTATHPILAPFIIIAWKAIGNIFPPIPGGVLTLALIPAIGWLQAYIYSSVGSLIGCSVAFWIARRFREPVVKRLVPLQELNKWESRLSGPQEFWTFLLIRLTTATVFDVMSYVFGLSRISFKRFFIITVIVLLPDALVFYFSEAFYRQIFTKSWLIGIILLLTLCAAYFLSKRIRLDRDQHIDKPNKNAG